ncbi:MAG TPA: phosphatase PAP2 family protein [Thermoanaerobaculia bacterium]|nr:phosphatase PAP2 family protein [Thermoanaerobaculia bacterium]
MSTAAKAHYAAIGFVALLLLSVFWPSPLVSTNQLLFHRHLDIDDLSFLGREAPSWDIAFWAIAGLFAIAIAQSANAILDVRSELRGMRLIVPRGFWIAVVVAIACVTLTWIFADSAIVAFAEKIVSQDVEDVVRYFNRLGGGINPPMIVLFFIAVGVAYRRVRWFAYGVSMALAGISAGVFAQIVKFAVGRTRPELWLGAFHYVRASAASFPSGHTVAAFSIGGVLIIGSRNPGVRIAALVLACGVAAARVLAFRHWPSDVIASALVGLIAAWIAYASTSAKLTDTSREQPASSIVTP